MHASPLVKKFQYAWAGLKAAVVREQSLRIQSLAGIVVVVTGAVVGLTRLEWAFVVAAVGAVLSLELVNSAVEKALDLLHPHEHEQVRFVKDVLAAAVLLASLAAAVIGLLIFLPHVL
ncbi:MAG: diacylglycerol kinase [Nitrospirales bacterium]